MSTPPALAFLLSFFFFIALGMELGSQDYSELVILMIMYSREVCFVIRRETPRYLNIRISVIYFLIEMLSFYF